MLLQKVAKESRCHSREGWNPFFSGSYKGMDPLFQGDDDFLQWCQMRRCAVSIPSNIAEGAARASKKEFTQFLHIALGSASELDTQIQIAQRVGYIQNVADLRQDILVVKKMINALITSLKK